MLEGAASAPIGPVVEAVQLVGGPIDAVVEAREGVAPGDRVVGKWPKACRVSEMLGALMYCSMVEEHCRSLAMVHSCFWVVEPRCSMTEPHLILYSVSILGWRRTRW